MVIPDNFIWEMHWYFNKRIPVASSKFNYKIYLSYLKAHRLLKKNKITSLGKWFPLWPSRFRVHLIFIRPISFPHQSLVIPLAYDYVLAQRSRSDIVRQLNPYVAHIISHQTDLLPPETLSDAKIRYRYHLLHCIIRLTTKAETSCD